MVVKQQPLGIEVVFRCPHRLQSALLPVWPVPAPKGRFLFFDALMSFFVNFIMSVLDVGKSFRHVFSCKFSNMSAMAFASVCVLEILNQEIPADDGFCLWCKIGHNICLVLVGQIGRMFSPLCQRRQSVPFSTMKAGRNKSSFLRQPRTWFRSYPLPKSVLVSSTVFSLAISLFRLSCLSSFSIGESCSCPACCPLTAFIMEFST